MSDNSATNNCGTYSYGETEDYSVTVSGGTIAAPTLTGTTARAEVRTLSMFPNPATDMLNLALSDNATISSAVVYDLRGARVAGATFAEGTLRIGSLAKGMYTLTVSDGEKVYHQRFVKE